MSDLLIRHGRKNKPIAPRHVEFNFENNILTLNRELYDSIEEGPIKLYDPKKNIWYPYMWDHSSKINILENSIELMPINYWDIRRLSITVYGNPDLVVNPDIDDLDFTNEDQLCLSCYESICFVEGKELILTYTTHYGVKWVYRVWPLEPQLSCTHYFVILRCDRIPVGSSGKVGKYDKI